jgi:o-succinylbenzoate synthase
MRVTSVELRTLQMPLVSPFTTSFGTETVRDALVLEVRAEVPGPDGRSVETLGWGECVASAQPLYSSEYLQGACDVTRRYLLPRIFACQRDDRLSPETAAHAMAPIVGHRMAKAAVEMALLDAVLRGRRESLAHYLGATRTRVPSGVSVGIQDSVPQLVDTVAGYLDAGYVRIKLKIKPGWDIEPVRAVRERFGDIPLQVDANAAYTLVDAPQLRRLDEFDLLLIEQPLAEDDLYQHAQLAKLMRTPMCLDESIVSAEAAAVAIALGAAAVINVKPGRVGGYLEAKRIHDLARAHGIAVWCGGMLETGLGRGANAALAALPGFTLPGDISASDRFYAEDITRPFVIEDGQITVPTGPGLGVEPIPDVIDRFTVERDTVTA